MSSTYTPGVLIRKPTFILWGLFVLLALAAVCLGVLLSLAGGLVWTTGLFESWLNLPPTSMLVASLGVAIIGTVLVAQSRIVAAIRAIGRAPSEMLRDHLAGADLDEDDDDSDEVAVPAPVAKRARRG